MTGRRVGSGSGQKRGIGQKRTQDTAKKVSTAEGRKDGALDLLSLFVIAAVVLPRLT